MYNKKIVFRNDNESLIIRGIKLRIIFLHLFNLCWQMIKRQKSLCNINVVEFEYEYEYAYDYKYAY